MSIKLCYRLKIRPFALLIQLPPSLKITEGIENIRQYIVPELDSSNFRYAVEVRDRSWFQDLAYNFFADNNICMAWSQLAELKTPPIATTDFLYLRFIGDRTINEKDFGKIQNWSNKLKRVIKGQKGARGRSINLAIVSSNNHYAGFGPETANIFRKMIGLPSINWQEAKKKYDKLVQTDTANIPTEQKSLSDYL
ncbi:MAG: DUF72 domain-containing protein [Nitrososphaeraceae archaeon]